VISDNFVEKISNASNNHWAGIILVILHNESKSISLNGNFFDSGIRCIEITKLNIRLNRLVE
jgi:hypothetical protein